MSADSSNFVAFLSSIDLAVLAGSLAILAVYPVLASDNSEGFEITRRNLSSRRRRSMFFWLGVSAATAWLSLVSLLIRATFEASGNGMSPALWNSEPQGLVIVLALVLAFSSLLASAKAGYEIFRMAYDALG